MPVCLPIGGAFCGKKWDLSLISVLNDLINKTKKKNCVLNEQVCWSSIGSEFYISDSSRVSVSVNNSSFD